MSREALIEIYDVMCLIRAVEERARRLFFAPDGPVAVVGEPGATHPRYINALDWCTGLPFTTRGQAEEAVGRR